MALTLDDLYASPDHYLHSFEGEDAVFVPMDRAAYHRSIFLDHRISAASEGSLRVSVESLANYPVCPKTMSWIFQIAHCGSTLLARALDQPDYALVLREPFALRQIALDTDRQRLPLVRAMLGKRYLSNIPTIAKGNVPINSLLPSLIALSPGDHAIFLYCPLRDYLLAVLRTPEHRAWVRGITSQLCQHLGDLEGASDAERAAALWLFQMRAFKAAMLLMPGSVSLDATRFFEAPHIGLAAAASHFGMSLPAARVAQIVEGPIFATNAKRPGVPFDNAARMESRASLEHTIRTELDDGQAWVEASGAGEVTLDRPLIAIA